MSARYNAEAVSNTIEAIYAAAVAPQQWMAALWQVRALYAAGSAALVVHNADRSRAEGISAGIDPDDHRRQFGANFRTTPAYSRRLREAVSGQVDRVCDLVPRASFIRSSMYQDLWRPYGMDNGMRLTVSVDRAGIHHAINLMKPASGGAFDLDDIAMARILMPHLQRAVAIQRRLDHADVTEASALSTLNLLRHAVLLLDEDGRVLHANALAETLLLRGDALGAKHGILYAATASVTAALHAVLAAAAGREDVPMRAGSLPLPKPAGGTPLSLMAMPFQQEAHWSLSRRVAILVCITDSDAAPGVPGRLMMELFSLTGAEARLSIELMAGKELRDIARDSGRSINTVRTLLARVMAKTGVNRQSDLMRLMANLPRAGEPDRPRDPAPGTAPQSSPSPCARD